MSLCLASENDTEGSVLPPIIPTGEPGTDAFYQALLHASTVDIALLAIALSRKEREEARLIEITTVVS